MGQAHPTLASLSCASCRPGSNEHTTSMPGAEGGGVPAAFRNGGGGTTLKALRRARPAYNERLLTVQSIHE